LHGQQVGVATLTMARLQSAILSSENAPVLSPTVIDFEGMVSRMGEDVAAQCLVELEKKAFDAKSADEFNVKIEKLWPELRSECLDIAVPAERLKELLKRASAPTTAFELGLPVEFYCEAVSHAHEMRNRFSFADIATHTSQMSQLASGEI